MYIYVFIALCIDSNIKHPTTATPHTLIRHHLYLFYPLRTSRNRYFIRKLRIITDPFGFRCQSLCPALYRHPTPPSFSCYCSIFSIYRLSRRRPPPPSNPLPRPPFLLVSLFPFSLRSSISNLRQHIFVWVVVVIFSRSCPSSRVLGESRIRYTHAHKRTR